MPPYAFALSAGCLQVADGDENGTQYAGHLGVFVNKCQGVGDVVVSQVYHRATLLITEESKRYLQ